MKPVLVVSPAAPVELGEFWINHVVVTSCTIDPQSSQIVLIRGTIGYKEKDGGKSHCGCEWTARRDPSSVFVVKNDERTITMSPEVAAYMAQILDAMSEQLKEAARTAPSRRVAELPLLTRVTRDDRQRIAQLLQRD
jgi:hypothetical protein